MNKRTKIIISIVCLTIIQLALIGLSYAYYLTRIQGNTNPKSISVTTTKLELVYGDNSAEIIQGTEALIPSKDITSSGAIGTKTFTVTNNGLDSSYVVVIDNVSTKIAGTNTPTEFVSNDFRYTLTCLVKDKNGNVLEGETCNKVSNLDIFPINGGILVGNDILENRVHEYNLTLWYIDTGLDQSDDMGKILQARINIKDMTATNPFQTGVSAIDNKSLVYNIINNAITNKNGTTLVNNPLTTPAKGSGNIVYTSYTDPTSFSSTSNFTSNWYVYGSEITLDKNGYFKILNPQVGQFSNIAISMINGYTNDYSGYRTEEVARKAMNDELSKVYKIGPSTTTSKLYYEKVTKNSENIESVLSVTTDDYGTSYYFRGGVTDNYVNFAGMCWRVVRIEGDGSVKLILEDRNEQCNDKDGLDLNNNGTYFTGNWSDGNQYELGFGSKHFLNGELADSFKTFQTTKLTTDDLDKLKIDDWCFDDRVTSTETTCFGDGEECYSHIEYGAYTRIYQNKRPSLKCTGTKLTKFNDGADMYVGTLTADEISFSGAFKGDSNTPTNYYLMNTYAKDKKLWWNTMSLAFDEEMMSWYGAFALDYNADMAIIDSNEANYSRPAVVLKSGSLITKGDGTQGNPYVIR